MATTHAAPDLTQGVVIESPVAAPPKAQPLWRFALIGLGPLGALAVFGLLLALFQRMM